MGTLFSLVLASMQLLFTLFYLLAFLRVSASSSSPQRLWCHVLGGYPAMPIGCRQPLEPVTSNSNQPQRVWLACDRAVRAMQEQQTFGDALRAAGLQ